MTSSESVAAIVECAAQTPLIDHHVHGALRADVDRDTFETMISEASFVPSAASAFNSQVGFGIRRWCAPLLGLPRHVDADDYWATRSRLGETEVTRRLLAGTGTTTYLLETGYLGDAVLNPTEMAAASGAEVREVVRLEAVAESMLAEDLGGVEFVATYADRLRTATAQAAGVKSIVAYRFGFDFDPSRPAARDVVEAVSRLPNAGRIDDPVVLRFLLWQAVDLGLPIQLHSGYGDRDLDLHRCNPLLLMPWLRLIDHTRVPVLLLHNYPYHREAGYLAQVFDNVHFDVGLGINYVGAQSRQLIAESLELAPFHKQLFSSDAWGPAELHLLGATLWRQGIASVVGDFVANDDWSLTDGQRVIEAIAHGNAARVYGL